MISQATIKAIQDVMRKDVGVDGDAQRLGQLVWLIFLKVFDDRESEWEIVEQDYVSPLPEAMRWRTWAADDEGRTGDELLSFVNVELFTGLKNLRSRAGASPDRTLLIRSVFEDAYNYMKSGVLLRQVVNILQRDLDYNRREHRHAFGDIYETLLKGLQSAGDAGEYYTPRPVTQFAVEKVDPQLGEVVIDPACGTGGFLLCALNHVKGAYVDSVEDHALLQNSIRGVEKKPLPHLLATTNMLLHGIDVPTNIRHDNTLARPLRDYGPDDRVDCLVTNPPFRGTEEDGIENNFPAAIRTRETADLFLALTMHLLKQGGRAAIVLPDSSLFGEGVKAELRRRLLRDCNLHTIVRLPYGVFSPYTDIRTNLLFFTKGDPTKETWFYELRPPGGDKYTKTKPIRHDDFDVLRAWWSDRRSTDAAWQVLRSDLAQRGDNLDVPNPHSLNIQAALARARTTREQAAEELGLFRRDLPGLLESAPFPVAEDVRSTLLEIGQLAGQVSLTSGVVEDFRVCLTGLALRGLLSRPESGDEDVATTLGRYEASQRKRLETVPPQPFPVPVHWHWVQLGDVADFAIGRTPSTKEDRYWSTPDDEGTSWISISDMPRRGVVQATGRQVTETAVREVFKADPVPTDALLMAFKLSVGKTALSGVPAFHNEAIASMQLSDDVLKHYLLWALPALARHAAANPAVRGATLNSKSIPALWVPIPPRQEQERLLPALRWTIDLIEELAYRAEESRAASDRVLKLLTQEHLALT